MEVAAPQHASWKVWCLRRRFLPYTGLMFESATYSAHTSLHFGAFPCQALMTCHHTIIRKNFSATEIATRLRRQRKTFSSWVRNVGSIVTLLLSSSTAFSSTKDRPCWMMRRECRLQFTDNAAEISVFTCDIREALVRTGSICPNQPSSA